MDKEQVAVILDEIGTLLELQGENSFRCLAYKNAARAIEQMEGDLDTAIEAGKLGEIRGIGQTRQEKIKYLSKTRQFTFFEGRRGENPARYVGMLRNPRLV